MKIVVANIKKYWYYFTIGILTIVYFFLFFGQRNKVKNFLNILQSQLEENKKTIEELKKIREEEEQKRKQIEEKYQQTIKEIERTHREAIANLDRQKKEEIKKIIEELQDDPNKMAESIHNLLGIPIQ
jgi:F0F1-type ATP synthase membrane subunit b/b'